MTTELMIRPDDQDEPKSKYSCIMHNVPHIRCRGCDLIYLECLVKQGFFRPIVVSREFLFSVAHNGGLLF